MVGALRGMLVCVVLGLAPTSFAVIVAGGDGSQNTTGEGVPGWEHVGFLNGATGVYVGNGWVLTAAHVSVGTFQLPGRGSFPAVPDSSFRLVDPVTSAPTDMTMFRISGDPGLPTLTIAPLAPTQGRGVFMIGYGRNRSPSQIFWSVNTSNPANWVWTELTSSSGANASGYRWASGQTKRWGSNVIDNFPGSSDVTGIINAGFGDLRVFTTYFTNISGEGQGAAGDSGGAVFDAGGRLIGLMTAIGGYPNQPAETAVFGMATYSADLFQYRNQIAVRINVVPEPSALATFLPALALMTRRRGACRASREHRLGCPSPL